MTDNNISFIPLLFVLQYFCKNNIKCLANVHVAMSTIVTVLFHVHVLNFTRKKKKKILQSISDGTINLCLLINLAIIVLIK